MGRSRQSCIYQNKEGLYDVDARYRKQRIRKRGFESHQQAADYLTEQKQKIKLVSQAGIRPPVTLEQGAIKLIEHKEELGLPSVVTDAYLLVSLIAHSGSLTLDEISNDALKPFIKARKAAGMKHKTINNALGIVNRICHLAATDWRLPNKLTWIAIAPKVDMLDLSDQRPPRPLTWAEQNALLRELPPHLQKMALFDLNTGARENVVCELRWEWEVEIKLGQDLTVSIFIVPRRYVKGRKRERLIICNSVAQKVVDGQRGLHPEYVFTYYKKVKPGRGKVAIHNPTGKMNNTAWQSARTRAGLGDLHVHDLRHTVGMRLRHAGISERTQDEILWHSKKDMTSHYAVAQVKEIYNALEEIKEEGLAGETLDLLALVRRTQVKSLPQNYPTQRKAA
ncbi:MAG: site-specific integrase [Candidimonas sp.]|nr:MAG: site-specific integrase [Candidimonas sp.]TAM23719.1 MAG: site-specific integrase [Candidimonas sp.]